MKKNNTIDILLSNIIKQKEDIVGELIAILKTTNDIYIGNKIALTLVDHFKDERIETCLLDLINEHQWQNKNGTILYALGEYTNDPKYLYFLIDMLLKNEEKDDGEIFMGTYKMIINSHPPIDKKEIVRALQRVKEEENKINSSEEKRKLVYSLLNYLEGQKNIAQYYKQFGDT
jgi:hypothetical protein